MLGEAAESAVAQTYRDVKRRTVEELPKGPPRSGLLEREDVMTRTESARQRVQHLLYAAIDELNETLPLDGRVEKSPTTVLFGEASTLESLALVNLIVSIEQKLLETYTVSLGLAESLMEDPQRGLPETVDGLSDHIVARMEN